MWVHVIYFLFTCVKPLLINCLELCLALTADVTTTKYIEQVHVLVYNEQTNCLHMYKRLLTNHLLGKAAELCLVNS